MFHSEPAVTVWSAPPATCNALLENGRVPDDDDRGGGRHRDRGVPAVAPPPQPRDDPDQRKERGELDQGDEPDGDAGQRAASRRQHERGDEDAEADDEVVVPAVDGDRDDGWRPSQTSAAGLLVRRHTSARIAAAASAAVSWNQSRLASGESPATEVAVAENPTQTGPNTDPRSRHTGLSRGRRDRTGSRGELWRRGSRRARTTIRPYIVYDHRSFDDRGGVATENANTTAITAAT